MISVIEHFDLGGWGREEPAFSWMYEIFARNTQSEPFPNTTSSV